MVRYKITFLSDTRLMANDREWTKVWALVVNNKKQILFSFNDEGKTTFFHDDPLSDKTIAMINRAVDANKMSLMANKGEAIPMIEGDTESEFNACVLTIAR